MSGRGVLDQGGGGSGFGVPGWERRESNSEGGAPRSGGVVSHNVTDKTISGKAHFNGTD